MPEITQEDLYMLVILATDYNSRLPYGVVPERIWKLLTAKQRSEFMKITAERNKVPEDPAALRLR